MITRESFLAFYPVFAGFNPDLVMDEYIALANPRFTTFCEDADEARRLFVAHKLTLYARGVLIAGLEDGATPTMEQIAAQGEASHEVASEKAGEVAVTYASSKASTIDTAFADLTESIYGLQLLSLIQAHSFGIYIP